jgi:hypothetical protein
LALRFSDPPPASAPSLSAMSSALVSPVMGTHL